VGAAFRAHPSAGTLKPEDCFLAGADRHAFRAHPSAATLKHLCQPRHGSGQLPLPRSPERGHIEASRRRRAREGFRPFRAHPSAATLKLLARGLNHRLDDPFRAHPSAATLKPVHEGQGPRGPRSFRAHLSAATLKLGRLCHLTPRGRLPSALTSARSH